MANKLDYVLQLLQYDLECHGEDLATAVRGFNRAEGDEEKKHYQNEIKKLESNMQQLKLAQKKLEK